MRDASSNPVRRLMRISDTIKSGWNSAPFSIPARPSGAISTLRPIVSNPTFSSLSSLVNSPINNKRPAILHPYRPEHFEPAPRPQLRTPFQESQLKRWRGKSLKSQSDNGGIVSQKTPEIALGGQVRGRVSK